MSRDPRHHDRDLRRSYARRARGHVLLRILTVIVALVAFALWWDSHRAISHAPGVLAQSEPLQRALDGSATPFQHGEFRITPLAKFELSARVLSRQDYSFDTEAELAPTDLALGWARMSDSAVIERISISQSGRWYSWYTLDPPIPLAEIAATSANMHLIPATPSIASALAQVRTGQIVALSGYLVEVQRPRDGWRWVSSLSRTDTGAGSCEVIFVQALTTR